MRLSANGRRLVYVAGLGEHPPQPVVTVRLEDGRDVPIAPGHHPAWAGAEAVLFCPQTDGRVQSAAGPGWLATDTPTLAGNTLTAGGGLYAVHRTDPRRVLTSTGRLIPNAMDPAISDDGRWLAYVLADTDDQGAPRQGISTLFVDRADGSQARRAMWEGAPTRPRFGGTTLAWQIGRGLIAACADVANPAVGATAFALPGAWKITHPVPVWVPTRGELWVLFVADDGENGHIYLASWTSLRLGEPRGYQLGVSTGSAFDHDARPVDLDRVSVQWLDPLGRLDGATKKLTEPRVALDPPVKPDPPPTPEPPPDVPWKTDPDGVVEDIWPWIANSAVMSPDGRVAFIPKSDEVSADGISIGEWWDVSDDPRDFNVGHLEDASTGHRLYEGKRYYAHEWVALGQPVPWASLPLARNRFSDGARLWLPRRCVSGYRQRYVTDITWNNGYVQPHISMEIRVDVGYGRYQGREARVRQYYVPGGNAEENWFGATGWIKHVPAGVS